MLSITLEKQGLEKSLTLLCINSKVFLFCVVLFLYCFVLLFFASVFSQFSD